MNYYIDRIILNYSVSISINKNIPEELCDILKRTINLEKRTNKPIMKVLITETEQKVFEDFMQTIPSFFNI